MFKKALGSALLLLLLVLIYFLYYFFYVVPKDIQGYQKYVDSVQNTQASNTKQPAQQRRTKVQKDIWHSHEGMRLHYQIDAEESILRLTPSARGLALQEELKDIDCLLQEKLYVDTLLHPMQQLNTFHANHGVYDFSTHVFSTNTVFLDFYTLPGHEIPKVLSGNPFLRGKARSVVLTLSAQGAAFHAQHFTAQMDLKARERL